MEFLYKLYDNENFGIALFIAITILTFLFLVILFFGKKDEKKRKIEETNQLNLGNANTFKEADEIIKDLNIPEIEQPVLENISNDENNNSENLDLNIPTLDTNISGQSIVNDPQKIEEKTAMEQLPLEQNLTVEEKETPSLNDFNIDNLFQTNLENTNLQNEKNSNNVIEESQSEILFNPIETPKEDIPQTEIKEESPKIEVPFSSVYMNNENQNIFSEVKENNIFSEKNDNSDVKEKDVASPIFELPKMAEKPKEETKKIEEGNINSELNAEKISDFDNLFKEVETETYNINE